jgi:hypothetical protein
MDAVVSHSAGGADLLSSWIRRNRGHYRFYLSGPAVDIFSQKLGLDIRSERMPTAHGANRILATISWESDWELDAIRLAQQTNTPVVLVLDHWVNFEERHARLVDYSPPDAIWVSDDRAAELVGKSSFTSPTEVIGNLASLDVVEAVKIQTAGTNRAVCKKNVLFLGENLTRSVDVRASSESHERAEEVLALKAVVRHLFERVDMPTTLRVRPHPTESLNKYAPVLAEAKSKSKNLVIEPCAKYLVDDLAWSSAVYGISSMAMVHAVLCGRPTTTVSTESLENFPLAHFPIKKLEVLDGAT